MRESCLLLRGLLLSFGQQASWVSRLAQSAILYVLVNLQVLEKLAIHREKGRTEAIYTTQRIKGITDSIALMLEQATTFTNLNITLLVATSYKSTVVLVIYKVGINNDIGDFRSAIVARRLRRRGTIGRRS